METKPSSVEEQERVVQTRTQNFETKASKSQDVDVATLLYGK